MEQTENVWYATISNEYIADNVTVKKVDEKGSSLAGATFVLQKKNASDTWVNVSGYFESDTSVSEWILEKMIPGEYQIIETVAPAGYYMMTETVPFTIKGDGTIIYADIADDDIKYDVSTHTFTITNHTGTELPNTGGPGKYIYTICGLFFMAASLLCGIGQRRKRERGEEI